MRRALAAVLVLLAASPATAQERPWAEGVSPARQAEALSGFEDGNRLFEQGHYREALAIYARAVAAWDHPAIRYNMAVARIHLDQPLVAHLELERALRYGGAALEPQVYSQALTYQKLLLGQLARLAVVCREPGAQVLLDGELLFVGPGEATRVLLPGAHQLVASKPGFVTATRAVSLVAGQLTAETIQVAAVPPPPRTERRWAPWKPWVVMGAGAAVALAGVPLQLDAAATMDEHDAEFSRACPDGCLGGAVPEAVRNLEDRAKLENRIAVSMFVAGGAAVAAGVVMVLRNQPRAISSPGSRVTITPMPGGLVVTAAF